MLSRVHIFCFLASYAVALALEASRLWFRSGVRGIVMLGFVVAGWIAHTAFLYYRAVDAVQLDHPPLSSNQDWLLLAAWVLVMVYFYLACYHTATHFGVFLLPLVLCLILAARFADAASFSREPARVWGVIHGTSILLATVTVFFGFAAGLMYLEQANRLKRKPTLGTWRPPFRRLRLPSLEWLQTANSRAMLASMLLVGVAVASGIVLNRLKDSPRVLWKDPVVWVTLAMFGWLLLHVVIGAFYRPIRQGRKVAYLTMVSFVFLVFALVIFTLSGMFDVTKHGGRAEGKAGKEKVQVLDPIRLARMVNQVGQLARNAETSRPHPARLDGESGCPASADARCSQATSFTIQASWMGSCRFLFPTLAIQPCSSSAPRGHPAGWGPKGVCNDGAAPRAVLARPFGADARRCFAGGPS